MNQLKDEVQERTSKENPLAGFSGKASKDGIQWWIFIKDPKAAHVVSNAFTTLMLVLAGALAGGSFLWMAFFIVLFNAYNADGAVERLRGFIGILSDAVQSKKIKAFT